MKASKKRQGEILTHVCDVTQMHRKAAVRKFKRLQMRHASWPDRRGRPAEYGPDVTYALRTIWEAGNEVCGELLHPVTAEYIAILQRDRMWQHAKESTDKLLVMSESTMKRRVSLFMKARKQRKGISSTSPSHLKRLVPTFRGPWHDKPPWLWADRYGDAFGYGSRRCSVYGKLHRRSYVFCHSSCAI